MASSAIRPAMEKDDRELRRSFRSGGKCTLRMPRLSHAKAEAILCDEPADANCVRSISGSKSRCCGVEQNSKTSSRRAPHCGCETIFPRGDARVDRGRKHCSSGELLI